MEVNEQQNFNFMANYLVRLYNYFNCKQFINYLNFIFFLSFLKKICLNFINFEVQHFTILLIQDQ